MEYINAILAFVVANKLGFFLVLMVAVVMGYMLDAARQGSDIVERQRELNRKWDEQLANSYTDSGWSDAAKRGECHSMQFPRHRQHADLYADNNHR